MVKSEYFLSLPAPFEWSAIFAYDGEVSSGAPHQHNSFQFAYVLSGGFYFDFADGVCPAGAGELVVISPDLPHVWRSAKDGCHLLTFLCGLCGREKCGEVADILAPWVRNRYWKMSFPMREVESFRRMVRGIASGVSTMRSSLLFGHHFVMMSKYCESIVREYGVPTRDERVPERVLKALYFIESNYGKPLTLEDLAFRAGLSPSRFSEVFRAAMGTSPIRFLNQFRIKKAESLLRHSGLGIEQIADRTGFRSSHYFCRMFKQLNGIPPGHFKKTHNR
jgi:AraC-like DNA-binding protein